MTELLRVVWRFLLISDMSHRGLAQPLACINIEEKMLYIRKKRTWVSQHLRSFPDCHFLILSPQEPCLRFSSSSVGNTSAITDHPHHVEIVRLSYQVPIEAVKSLRNVIETLSFLCSVDRRERRIVEFWGFFSQLIVRPWIALEKHRRLFLRLEGIKELRGLFSLAQVTLFFAVVVTAQKMPMCTCY